MFFKTGAGVGVDFDFHNQEHFHLRGDIPTVLPVAQGKRARPRLLPCP